MAVTFELDPDYADELRRLSLDSFDALATYGGGAVAHEKAGQTVTRIDGDDGRPRFYLKRTTGDPVASQLASWLRGRRPHASAWRELRMIRAIERAGIDVMKPIAWGERRCCGLSRQAALLVRAVPGESAEHALHHADDALRARLLTAIGDLAGRLHAAGFFGALRLRDMVCEPIDPSRDAIPRLVLIDRETRDPRPAPFTIDRAARALARTWLKFRRHQIELTAAQRDAAIGAYRNAIAPLWPVTSDQLIAAVEPHVHRLSGPGSKYEDASGA